MNNTENKFNEEKNTNKSDSSLNNSETLKNNQTIFDDNLNEEVDNSDTDIINLSDTQDERCKVGLISSLVTWLFNVFLAISKIVIGSIFNTIALLADGINNLFDSISSCISLIGFKISNKPADKEHPFGHARIEYIASLIISFIVIFVGAQLAVSSVQLIIKKETTIFSYLSFAILAVSIVIKLSLFFFNKISAKKINSTMLKGIAIDCLNDVFSSSIVLIGFIISYYAKISLDGYLGIIVSIFIILQGVMLAKDIITPLLGEKANKTLITSVIKKVKSYEGVLGTHDLVCHCYGSTKCFISLHVEVDANVDVMISHELIDKIETDINNENLHLVIHMDPIVKDNELVNEYFNFLSECIKKIDTSLTFHDFRMVIGPNRKNIIFDIVIPFDCKISKTLIKKILNEEFHDYDSTTCLVINIDNDYSLY